MEKRALVALVLSLAVLLFWEYFFGLYRTDTPPPQKQEQAAPATTPEAQPGATPRCICMQRPWAKGAGVTG